MKSRKITFVLLFTFLFVLQLFSVTAAGAITLSLTPSVSEASRGETVTFFLKISENPGIMAMTLNFNIDENRLEFLGFEDGEVFTGWSATEKKAACVIGADSNFNGEILLLKYRVKADAPVGTAFVTILSSEGDLADSRETAYSAEVVPGTVLIKDNNQNQQSGNYPWLTFYSLTDGVLPRTGFSAIHSHVLAEKPLDLTYRPVSLTLEIPSVSSKAEIVEVPFVDGEYPITWLGNTVGLLEGFALPGKGYSVLTGHNHLNDTEAGPFAALSEVKNNDRIFTTDANGNMKLYVVYANEKIGANDLAAVEKIATMFENSITMITCEDELVSGGYANRRIVAAKPFGN